MPRAAAPRRLARLSMTSSCSTSGCADLPLAIEGTLAERIAQLRDELDGARPATSRCTSTCPTSGSRPTAPPPSPSPSTWRTRGSRSSRRRRCSRSRAASTSGACASCGTRPGHAIDNAFRLRLRRQRREVFGSPAEPYPEFYTPKPYSKSFVLHLDAWYAQSHPDEDFAETFAVWLTPNSEWRQRYAGWPALQEARIHGRADGVAARASRRACDNPSEVDPLRKLRKTLRQHYRNKRRHYGVDYPQLLRPRPAAAVLGRAGVRRQHHRRAVHRPHPPPGAPRGRRAGPASTSTRSIRCSRT